MLGYGCGQNFGPLQGSEEAGMRVGVVGGWVGAGMLAVRQAWLKRLVRASVCHVLFPFLQVGGQAAA